MQVEYFESRIQKSEIESKSRLAFDMRGQTQQFSQHRLTSTARVGQCRCIALHTEQTFVKTKRWKNFTQFPGIRINSECFGSCKPNRYDQKLQKWRPERLTSFISNNDLDWCEWPLCFAVTLAGQKNSSNHSRTLIFDKCFDLLWKMVDLDGL